MKFKVFKQIHSVCAALSSNDVFLQREIELPSIPPIGTLIGYEEVKEVCADWDGNIKIYVQEDRTFYQKSIDTKFQNYSETEEFKELVNEYLADGWKIEDSP